MAIAISNLGSLADATDLSTYTTPSVSPTANAGILVGVYNDGAATLPSAPTAGFAISGSWVQEATIVTANSNSRMTVFSAYASSSPGSGTVAVSFGGTNQTGCIITVDQATGVNATDFTNQPATSAPAGSLTSTSITLPGALLSSLDYIWAFIGHGANEDSNPSGSETELTPSPLAHATPNRGAISEYLANSATAGASWTTSSVSIAAIGIEIVEASVSAIPTYRIPALVSRYGVYR